MLDRWNPLYKHSSAYRVFSQYNKELNRLIMSFTSARLYTYSHLKTDGAKWESPAIDYLYTHNNHKLTIEDWKNVFNDFHNWILLNELMALSSYFETYIEVILKIAIESDPGLLIGKSRCVDGILLIKRNIATKDEVFKDELVKCVKGDWSSRIANIRKIFGISADIFHNFHSELEQMRILRNKIGHAFGRDIDDAREIMNVNIRPMERLSVERFLKFQKIVRTIVKQFDEYVMSSHIGNFLPLKIYHDIYPTVGNLLNIGERVHELKKKLGSEGRGTFSKDFCREVITYYEGI